MAIPTLPFGRLAHQSPRTIFGAAALARKSRAELAGRGRARPEQQGTDDDDTLHHELRRAARAAAMASITRSGAVPPAEVRAATLASTDSRSSAAAPIRGSIA